MRTLAHAVVLLAWLSMPGQPQAPGANQQKPAHAAKPGKTPQPGAAGGQDQAADPTPAEPARTPTPAVKQPDAGEAMLSRPFVAPTWLLFIFLAIVLGQVSLAVMYFGIRREIASINEEAAKSASDAVEPLSQAVADVQTRIGDLRQDIKGIRQSQEPILSLAVNRLASPIQFPFAPQVSDIEPDRGMVKGGTRVEIRGRNFSPDSQVWFGGLSAQAATTSTTSRLDVIAPPGSLGDADIYIVNPSGMMSQQRTVRYRYIDFRLDDIAAPPAGAPLGLAGDGFCAGTQVLVDGADGGKLTSWTPRKIEIPLPAGTQGQQRRVQLVNPGGDRTEEKQFLQP